MMLTDLATACRRSGLTVIERPGWTSRGRGGMSGVRTITCHHTAGPAIGDTPTLNIVENGRSDLAGPLGNLYLSRSGVAYVVAAGLANHAGTVMSPTTQGSAWSIGIEAEATGVDAWPPDQYAAYVRLVRALIDHYGLPVSAVLGHKETASPLGRKIDPNFSMPRFRADVEAARPETEDPFMALTDAEQREILAGQRKLLAEMGKLKPGVALPARSPNCRVKSDDEYGHTMNAEAEAADALAEIKQFRTEVKSALAKLTVGTVVPTEMTDEVLQRIAVAVNDELARRLL